MDVKQETKGEDTHWTSSAAVGVELISEMDEKLDIAEGLRGPYENSYAMGFYHGAKDMSELVESVLISRGLHPEHGESSSKGHAELPAFPIEKLQARLAEEANKAMRAEELGRYFGLNDVRDWIKELEAEENIGGGGKDA